MSYTPLTDGQIQEIAGPGPDWWDRNVFARAIEAAATAPLLAHIEALRAEIAFIKEVERDHRKIIAEFEAALVRVSKDAHRLDWLDSLNAALNKQNGTTYGWKLILSPNIVRLMAGKQANGFVSDVDLNDANTKGATSCRAAIDATMKGTP